MVPVSRRQVCGILAAPAALAATASVPLSLGSIRADVLACCETVRDKGGPYGCYRGGPRKRPDLYASCDVAEMRAIMGEDLGSSLSELQRREWIDHINSFVDSRPDRPSDGSYFDTHGHSSLHANGMIIGALGALGGRQVQPVRLYDDFSTGEKAIAWLEGLDWSHQWQASHLLWGGVIPFSFSRSCPPGWCDQVFTWLDRNLDPETGWWRRGTAHADRHQPLGGSVHILPLYQHHERPFPYPDRVIDSVLALQLPSGRWLAANDIHVMSYLELDALYALDYMARLAPNYRHEDIRESVQRYVRLVAQYYPARRPDLFSLHPHTVLAAVGTFGLLRKLAPDEITGRVGWTDIFNDARFYRTRAVEAEREKQ